MVPLIAALLASVHADLAPFLKQKQVIINVDYSEIHTSLFLKTVDQSLFKTETFTNNLEKLMYPALNPPTDIVEQIKTIKSIYADLNALFKKRKTLLGNNAQKPEPCQVTYQLFTETSAKQIINEINLIVSDLPDVTTDLSIDKHAKKTSALLMQALLDLNKIHLYLTNEILELESLINYLTTPHAFLAIQNSNCIEKNANEKVQISQVDASPNGLTVHITVLQYRHSINTYALIATPYFGFSLDLQDVYLIDDTLAKCNCLFNDGYISTGCICSPLDEACNSAITLNQILEIFNICPIIPAPMQGPQPTLTGVLFPSYYPFTLKNSDLTHLLPPPSSNYPFHVTSSHKFEITYLGRKLQFQAASSEIPDSVEQPNFPADILDKIRIKYSPVSTSLLYEILTYSLLGLTGLLIVPLLLLLSLRKTNLRNNITIHNPEARRPVNLTLAKLI